ncbi:cation diffusion facilitator family transporter [Boudabousia marimammalium]|uniref:Cation transporter n=1 Tax=Boudabousia marimammalium TaxID=156892 RepID=A0A1Q5PST5_9ACTO|nr:cation diffusion facilitator family transporter [Boudabousia marimammalium]OKL50603.1 cation transporter [Boudabousia marimammalium]
MFGHSHDHSHDHSTGGENRRNLGLALLLTATLMVAEIVVGLWSGSLALLSDAAHMGTDAAGLAMAFAAITLAQRPPTAKRTYGLYRLEVLAALINAVLLIGVAGYVLYEAAQRISNPQPIEGAWMLATAIAGLCVNIAAAFILRAGAKNNINVRGAFLEVMADMIGSVGVIIAAVIYLTTGWAQADIIVGVGIGLFILPRTVRLARDAIMILLEAAPDRLNRDEIIGKIEQLAEVESVHDLHLWTISSGLEAATAHVVVAECIDHHAALDAVTEVLRDQYGIGHVTIQTEPSEHCETLPTL